MYNFDYKKSLGQNFLKDNNVVEKIVSAINYEDNNLVIEIGPGSGAMTKELLKRVDFAILYASEFKSLSRVKFLFFISRSAFSLAKIKSAFFSINSIFNFSFS